MNTQLGTIAPPPIGLFKPSSTIGVDGEGAVETSDEHAKRPWERELEDVLAKQRPRPPLPKDHPAERSVERPVGTSLDNPSTPLPDNDS